MWFQLVWEAAEHICKKAWADDKCCRKAMLNAMQALLMCAELWECRLKQTIAKTAVKNSGLDNYKYLFWKFSRAISNSCFLMPVWNRWCRIIYDSMLRILLCFFFSLLLSICLMSITKVRCLLFVQRHLTGAVQMKCHCNDFSRVQHNKIKIKLANS